jgi:hypothetical protein
VIALHDVDWPYGRRDMYYDPQTVPADSRQPHRRAGLLPGRDEPGHGGVNWNLDNAIHEGTERNGVRTAAEDFAEQSDGDWRLSFVPGFHGLGIAVTAERLEASAELRATIESVQSAEFLERVARAVELERVTAEIDSNRAVAEAQERIERQAKSGVEQRLAETDRLQELLVDAERRLAAVPELQAQIAALERELEAARHDAERAREEARLLDQRLTIGERVLSDVFNSPSWRVTQPLRTAKHLAPRVRQVLGR